MKKIFLVCMAYTISSIFYAQTIFINEIHYNNTGGDVNEGIEIAGPAGTNLSGYEVRFYNSFGNYYSTILNLTGIIPNQHNNLGTLWFSYDGIQNGPADGLVLIDSVGNLVQFLSYEGTIVGAEGVASGLTSVDIGVSENESTPIGYSLQLVGNGNKYSDFTWSAPMAATPGFQNTNQTLPITQNTIDNFNIYPNPVVDGTFTISTNNNAKTNVQICTLLGQKVFEKITNQRETLIVSHLKNGLYLLQVSQQGKTAFKKLLIAHK